jgi:hypothetical protein
VILKYIATPETEGGYHFKIGKFDFDGKVNAVPKDNLKTVEIGRVKLDAGLNSIQISATGITKNELMKILEVQLIPVITTK